MSSGVRAAYVMDNGLESLAWLVIRAPHALVAEFSPDRVIPLVLMIAGVLLLAIALRRGVGLAPSRPTAPESKRETGTEELDRVNRDARELAGLLASQLDRQAARLESLIAAADERIRKLERQPTQPPRSEREAAKDGADPLSQRVFEMADRGMPPVEIARALSQQTGKVELILALRGR